VAEFTSTFDVIKEYQISEWVLSTTIISN